MKPGDIVQFDWDGSGDWDHTGVVTSVSGSTILYSSHTADNHDQSIDSASAGRIMFWGSDHSGGGRPGPAPAPARGGAALAQR